MVFQVSTIQIVIKKANMIKMIGYTLYWEPGKSSLKDDFCTDKKEEAMQISGVGAF